MGRKARTTSGHADGQSHTVDQYNHFMPATKHAEAPIIKIKRLKASVAESNRTTNGPILLIFLPILSRASLSKSGSMTVSCENV
jgi:hypothetical protein